MAEELLENGVSPLDGILPKDPAFGKVEDSFADLLEKKVKTGQLTKNSTVECNIRQ